MTMGNLDNVKKGNLGVMTRFAEQSETQNGNSKPINLIFYLDYGALRKKYLDSFTNFINRHEKLKDSLDYSEKVLLPGDSYQTSPSYFECNRLAVDFYLSSIVAGTDCDKIFSKRLVPNPSESRYALRKWQKRLAIQTCNSYSICKIFIFCRYKLSGICYETCCNKESVCKL